MNIKNEILKLFGLHPLRGSTVWLCGSVPEREFWTHSLVDRDILEFVSVFSSLIFRNGGCIVHGSHPSFTPILVRQADKFAFSKKQLKLFISSRWEKEAVIGSGKYTTSIPAVYKNGDFDLAPSLTSLRKTMVSNVNSAVFIGGKLHLGESGVPRLDEEMNLAKLNGVPSFLIGGTDGFTKDKVDNEFVGYMNSFVPIETLKNISIEENLTVLPSQLISLLMKNSIG